jgi:hypothetical protein
MADAAAVAVLVKALERVPDHRKAKGRRFRLGELLAVKALARLSAAATVKAECRWARDRQAAMEALGLPLASRKTMLRAARDADAAAVGEALCAMVRHIVFSRLGPREPLAVAIDGKEPAGSLTRDAPAVRLVSVWRHATGAILGQAQVADKGGEQGALPGLLAQVAASPRAQTGRSGPLVVTLDANFCARPGAGRRLRRRRVEGSPP